MEEIKENPKGISKQTNINFDDFSKQLQKSLNLDKALSYFEKYFSSGLIEIFKDTEFLNSINAFLKSNLNLTETSRVSYLHRNTINYRIDKIQKVTGLNLRNFTDAYIFKCLQLVYELKIKGKI